MPCQWAYSVSRRLRVRCDSGMPNPPGGEKGGGAEFLRFDSGANGFASMWMSSQELLVSAHESDAQVWLLVVPPQRTTG
jgi:hypothetical protein